MSSKLHAPLFKIAILPLIALLLIIVEQASLLSVPVASSISAISPVIGVVKVPPKSVVSV